jgi:hypothetical protein
LHCPVTQLGDYKAVKPFFAEMRLLKPQYLEHSSSCDLLSNVRVGIPLHNNMGLCIENRASASNHPQNHDHKQRIEEEEEEKKPKKGQCLH